MKIIKDPIYGYIDLEEYGFIKLLNSPYFQRLRDILQTSYTSVYPTSLQNRFTHSLGVFHLGKIALKTLISKLSTYYSDFFESNQVNIDKSSYTFLIACLLHDIGHAPFSHTGEAFFLEKEIWKKLKDTLKMKSFQADAKFPTGAAHEIMSALIALNYLEKYIDKKKLDKELFARCIIGLKYTNKVTLLDSYKNCLIEMLHSDTIDVDRLDYLIRDSFMSGYCSVNIDYNRLLTSIYVTKNNKGLFEFTFTKHALSVLENVIIAHDSEKKWLQSHPTVLYESCLIAGMIKYAVSDFAAHGVNLFSEEALSIDGVGQDKYNIKLISDSDVKSFVKKYGYEEECVQSYYDREERRKPFWKSEAEYKVLFENKFSGKKNGNLIKIEEYFDKLNDLLNFDYLPVINDNAIIKLQEKLDQATVDSSANVEKFGGDERIILLEETIWLFKQLKELTEKYGHKLNFVIISANQFSSSFNKEKFENINIWFPDLNKSFILSEAINILSNNQSRAKFFYIFAPKEMRDTIPCSELINVIADFSQKYLEK